MSAPQTLFKTDSVSVPLSPLSVYASPQGYNSIVLTCQVVNTSSVEETFSLSLERGVSQSPLVFEYGVPPKEVLHISGGDLGTLVLNPGDSFVISGSSTELNFTYSVVQTLVLS